MEIIEQPTEELNGAQFNSDEGSMLGKFKDATSLLNAYNSLQAEFTRKSQRLKELEKNLAEAESLSPKESALQEHIDAEKEASENNACEQQEDLETKMSQKLLAFVQTNPEAVSEFEAIKAEISEQTKLLDLENGIEIAYRLVKEKQKSEPAELAKNPQFIKEYILSNSDITNTVIDEYVKSLAERRTAPKLMNGDSKSMVFSPNENLPKTLADANKIFSKMLEK